MSEKFTTARISKSGEKFEVLVKPDPALDYKMGKQLSIAQLLVIEEIYSDAGKGTRASAEKLQKAFGTQDPLVIAEDIMKHGELQLTTDQRRQLVEEKRKQIVAFVARNCIDPRTGTPHPPLRIEQAMNQIKYSIEPFKSSDEQAKDVIEELRSLLPSAKFGEAVDLSRKLRRGHLSKVLGLAIEEYRHGLEALRSHGPRDVGSFDVIAAVNRAVDRSSLRTVNDLRRGLGALATVGSTAPFVGLLGTVAGIITAFQQMAATGSGGLGTVSKGIAEALVTTAFGLLVAIPAVMMFNYLTNRVEDMQVDITDSATELVDFFMKEGRAE